MSIIELYIGTRDAWFRVFGYGLAFNIGFPLFSERNGYHRRLRVGKFSAHFLTPT